jgi:hypothetical protein
LEDDKNFKAIEPFVNFTAGHVKKLKIRYCGVNQKILNSLLNSFPNLEVLVLDEVSLQNKSKAKWNFQALKLKRIEINRCRADIESMLDSFKGIKEAKLIPMGKWGRRYFLNFLKSQGSGLEKLELEVDQDHFTYDFQDFKEFKNLRSLKLKVRMFNDEIFDAIYELKDLEELELDSNLPSFIMSDGMNKIHKLEKLRGLKLSGNLSMNIMGNLQFGVHNCLEDLDACFWRTDLESIEEIDRIVPNLKTLKMTSDSSETLSALLANIKNLESLTVHNRLTRWGIPTIPGPVFPKLKHLKIHDRIYVNPRKLARTFPNLESLKIEHSTTEIKKSYLVVLLSELKQLKELKLGTHGFRFNFDSNFVIQTIQNYGKNLRKIKIGRHLNEDYCEGGATCTFMNMGIDVKSDEIPGVEIIMKSIPISKPESLQ